MAELRPIQGLQCKDPRALFGRQIRPQFAKSYELADLGSINMSDRENLRFDALLELVYNAPVFVPHSTYVEDYEDEFGNEWMRFGGEDGYLACDPQVTVSPAVCLPVPATWLQLEELVPAAEPGLAYGRTDVPNGGCQGCTVYATWIPQYQAGDVHIKFDFWLTENMRVRLLFGLSRRIEVLLQWKDEEEGWIDECLGYIKNSDDTYAQMTEWVTPNSIEVIYLNQRMAITVGGGTTPLVIPIPEQDDYEADTRFIRHIGFTAQGFRKTQLSFSPMKFATSSCLVTNEENLGFSLEDEPEFRVEAVYTTAEIPGHVVDCYVPEGGYVGQFVQFEMDMTHPEHGVYKGQPWTHKTQAVKAITMNIPGEAVKLSKPWENLSRRLNPVTGRYQDYIRDVLITHQLDFNNLTIWSQAQASFSNRHGEFQNFGGLTGVQMFLGWSHLGLPSAPQFTGWGGIKHIYNRPFAPESTYTMLCQDASYQLRSDECQNLPWLDGWCHYYALRHIAQLGGMHADQLRYVYDPAVGYCETPNCGHDHYFLPMGDGGRPLMSFPPGTPFWDIMLRIRRVTGYLLYFDANGYLRYEPWIRSSPGPYKRQFFERPGPLNDMHALEYLGVVRDTDAVRNHLTIVGIDAYAPMWRPVVSHRADESSLTEYGKRNFLGFRRRAIWADSQFAMPEYASEAADMVFPVVSMPQEEVTFVCRGQPDLYPLDVIQIFELPPGKTGVTWYQGGEPRFFFITRITHRMVATPAMKMDYTSTITGRWIV